MAFLASPPSTRVQRYACMKVYGNHWCVCGEEDNLSSMDTYDSGVTCMAENARSTASQKDYIGELKDILVLDYGQLNTPIILFYCQWKKDLTVEEMKCT